MLSMEARPRGLPVTAGGLLLSARSNRAVDEAGVAGLAVELVLGDEDQVVLPAPALEQVLERLAHDRFARRAADLLQPVEFGEVLVDEDLAHGAAGDARAISSRRAPARTLNDERVRECGCRHARRMCRGRARERP